MKIVSILIKHLVIIKVLPPNYKDTEPVYKTPAAFYDYNEIPSLSSRKETSPWRSMSPSVIAELNKRQREINMYKKILQMVWITIFYSIMQKG
jgi:hypothetical protein